MLQRIYLGPTSTEINEFYMNSINHSAVFTQFRKLVSFLGSLKDVQMY